MKYNPDELNQIMNIDYITEKKGHTIVSSDEEFELLKRDVLKCHYVGLHRKSDALSIVCDNGKYFVVDMGSIPPEKVASCFVFIKPKKIIFDINNYKPILNDDSKGFIDIRLAFNLLFNKDFKKINNLIAEFEIPANARSTIYLIYSNFIQISRNINIYTERNKLNKAYYTEMDTATLLANVSNRGVEINISAFEDIKNNLFKQYNNIIKTAREEYGNDFDFNNKEAVFKVVKEGSRTLDPSLMRKSSNPLYEKYNTFKAHKWIDSLNVYGNKIYFDYIMYDDYRIKSDIALDLSFYGNEDVQIVKGEFGSLYYKIFAELSRDKNLIEAASENRFLEYINQLLFNNTNDDLCIYTDIILKCYADGVFEHFEVQKYALEKFDTILNVGDISNFAYLFETHLSKLLDFIKNFDGTQPEYDRYNKKIFYPVSSLDGFIKQITNLIFKLSLLDVESVTRDYTEKRRRRNDDSLVLCGVGKDVILVAATGDDAKQMAVDNLNRIMYSNYKYFVRNTKVYNTTSPLN